MTRVSYDQASGLRDLISLQATTSARVITVAGGARNVGKTTIIINLATALAEKGKRVLLIDENAYPNNICSKLGLKTRFDLIHAIQQDKRLDQIILQGPENIFVLSAQRGIHALSRLDVLGQKRLVESFGQFSDLIDVILIDTTLGEKTHVLPLSLASEQVIVVISGSAISLAGAYALIKMMSQEYAKKHFFVFVNKVDSESTAQTVFENFARVVYQYLGVLPEFAGFAQIDEKVIQSSRLCQSVLTLFPHSHVGSNLRRFADSVLHSAYRDHNDDEVCGFMERLIRTSQLSMNNLTV